MNTREISRSSFQITDNKSQAKTPKNVDLYYGADLEKPDHKDKIALAARIIQKDFRLAEPKLCDLYNEGDFSGVQRSYYIDIEDITENNYTIVITSIPNVSLNQTLENKTFDDLISSQGIKIKKYNKDDSENLASVTEVPILSTATIYTPPIILALSSSKYSNKYSNKSIEINKEFRSLKRQLFQKIQEAAKKYYEVSIDEKTQNDFASDMATFKVQRPLGLVGGDIDFYNDKEDVLDGYTLQQISELISALLKKIDTSYFGKSKKYTMVTEKLNALDNDYFEKIDGKEFRFLSKAMELEREVDEINKKNKDKVVQPKTEATYTSSIDIKPNEELITYLAISPKLRSEAKQELNLILDKVSGISEDLKNFLQHEIETLDFSVSKASSPKKILNETKTSFKEKLEQIKSNLDDANAYYAYCMQDYQLLQERSSYESLNHMSVSKLGISGISSGVMNIGRLEEFLRNDESQREQYLAQLKEKSQESRKKLNQAKLQYMINQETPTDLLDELLDVSNTPSIQYNPRVYFEYIRNKGVSSYDATTNYAELASEYAVLLDEDRGPNFINTKAGIINSLASYLDTIKQNQLNLLRLFNSRDENKNNPEQINAAAVSGEQRISEFFEIKKNVYSQFFKEASPITVIEKVISDLKAAQSVEAINAINDLHAISAKYVAFIKDHNTRVHAYAHEARELELKINNVMPDLILDLEKEKLLGESNVGANKDRLYGLYAVALDTDDSTKLKLLDVKLEKQVIEFNSLNQAYETARSVYLKQEASDIFPLAGVIFDVADEEIENSEVIKSEALGVDDDHVDTETSEDDASEDYNSTNNSTNGVLQFDFEENDEHHSAPNQTNMPKKTDATTENGNVTELDTVANESPATSVVEVSPKASYTRDEVLDFKGKCEACLEEIRSTADQIKSIKMPFVTLNQHRSGVAEDANEKYENVFTKVSKLISLLDNCILHQEATVYSAESILSEASSALSTCRLDKANVANKLVKIKSIVTDLENKNKYLTREEIDSKNTELNNLINEIYTDLTEAKIKAVKEKVDKANTHVEARNECLEKLQHMKQELLKRNAELNEFQGDERYVDFKDSIASTRKAIVDYIDNTLKVHIKQEKQNLNNLIGEINGYIKLVEQSKDSNTDQNVISFKKLNDDITGSINQYLLEVDRDNTKHNEQISKLKKRSKEELDSIKKFKEQLDEIEEILLADESKIDKLVLNISINDDSGPLTVLFHDEYKANYNILKKEFEAIRNLYDEMKSTVDSFQVNEEYILSEREKDLTEMFKKLYECSKGFSNNIFEFNINNQEKSDYLWSKRPSEIGNPAGESSFFTENVVKPLLEQFDLYIDYTNSVNADVSNRLKDIKNKFDKSSQTNNDRIVFMRDIQGIVSNLQYTTNNQPYDKNNLNEFNEGVKCIASLKKINMDKSNEIRQLSDVNHKWYTPPKRPFMSRVSNFFHDNGGYIFGGITFLSGIGLILAGALAVPIAGPIGVGLVSAGCVLAASGVGMAIANYVGNKQHTSNKIPSVNKPNIPQEPLSPIDDGAKRTRSQSQSEPKPDSPKLEDAYDANDAYFNKRRPRSLPTEKRKDLTPTSTSTTPTLGKK